MHSHSHSHHSPNPNHIHGHDHSSCGHSHHHHSSHDSEPEISVTSATQNYLFHLLERSLSSSNVGLSAVVATLAVSILPILFILVVPLSLRSSEGSFLKILLGFAVGGLLGDSFLHLIPHCLEEMSPHDVGFGAAIGAFSFLMLEKIIRVANHAIPASSNSGSSEDSMLRHKKKTDENVADHTPAHSHTSLGCCGGALTESKIGVLLNLLADFCHNATDGMAIAVSFMSSVSVGCSTAVAIMLHEIPHELGDYALLLQSGISLRGAMLCQLLTAVGAVLGCSVALLASHSLPWFQHSVLAFTAGGFVYVALVSILPGLMQGKSLGWLQASMEAIAMMVGFLLMLFIGEME